MKIGDLVRINSPVSKYNGSIGEIFAIQLPSGYAVVDMPKGTELAIEKIEKNTIIEQMTRSRKTPSKRCPNGDPQWFPMWWLEVVRESKSEVQEEDLFLEAPE
jgi:hypothetical protein